MSLNDDKRELLKLKQGLIEESDIIKEEKPPKTELHGRAKFDNIIYHYKYQILLCIFAAAVITFLSVDYFSRDIMDIRVLMVSSTQDAETVITLKSEQLKEAFEAFCPDYNSDGEVHADAYIIELYHGEFTDPSMVMVNQTKLFGEMQAGIGQMILGNKDVFSLIIGEDEKIEDYFTDLSSLFPDGQVVDKYYYKVKGSALAQAASWEPGLPDDIYIAIRKDASGFGSNPAKNEEYRKQALEVLENIDKNNVVS